MRKKIVFFITIKKSTKEIILQEGNLISLKIPQHWQKPDSNVKIQPYEFVIYQLTLWGLNLLVSIRANWL